MIQKVMERLYASEINCSVSSFWDGGWTVKLGDEMNGFITSGDFDTLEEVAVFLDKEARRLWPSSKYNLTT